MSYCVPELQGGKARAYIHILPPTIAILNTRSGFAAARCDSRGQVCAMASISLLMQFLFQLVQQVQSSGVGAS
jgi:hypothetical protein